MHFSNAVLPLLAATGPRLVSAASLSHRSMSRESTRDDTCSVSGDVQPISVSQSKPANAVQVPNNFIGFGADAAFLTNYANAFSENLINSVADRVGATLIIRVGGASGDLALFDPDQAVNTVCISGDCPVGSGATYILGPSYFEAFTYFPNQQFTFQAPLGPTVNTTNSLDYVTRAYGAIGASRVAAIAIGNERDAYSSTYSAQEYVTAALALEPQIVSALGLSSSDQIFEVIDLSSGSGNGVFTVEEALAEGLDASGNVKFVAQHWYQSPVNLPYYGEPQLQEYLMNHSAITSRFQTGYAQALAYTQQNYPSASYVLTETGSALAGPPINYDDGFGACLWYLDFNLYSMSVGVQRVDGTGRPAATHSLWVPDDSANNAGNETNIGPQVRGPYYATPMLADFLGTSSGSVVELLGDDTLTAYALYDSSTGDLRKIALLNMNYWSADTGGTRSNVTFQIPITGATHVTVGHLRADYGAHALGYDNQGSAGMITWQGETWSYTLDYGQGSQVQGFPQNFTVAVCNEVANIVVPDTEAVIVYV